MKKTFINTLKEMIKVKSENNKLEEDRKDIGVWGRGSWQLKDYFSPSVEMTFLCFLVLRNEAVSGMPLRLTPTLK
jgi:hypothetical protein